MLYDTSWKNKNPVCNPLSDDWFIWNPRTQNMGDWNVCIKCYINMSEIIATNLRNNIGSNDNLYNILGFLFCVMQALELSLKGLCKIKALDVKESHNLKDTYDKIKEMYNWEKYEINEKMISRAVEFMQGKNEIFRYPYDKKNTEYETVAVHLSDWLYLIHTLYYVITEEQGRNVSNAKNS